MLIAISTTKDENIISDNSFVVSTEILPLHSVQGQNDTIS
jgi:hypothetical protein